ncbi:hypothetical protein F441_02912 [Phytophthora nicotianae CJ01A1]|nr:hypothetical protein F441_02912 [Phytophthora nicotianae CJ01A1]
MYSIAILVSSTRMVDRIHAEIKPDPDRDCGHGRLTASSSSRVEISSHGVTLVTCWCPTCEKSTNCLSYPNVWL